MVRQLPSFNPKSVPIMPILIELNPPQYKHIGNTKFLKSHNMYLLSKVNSAELYLWIVPIVGDSLAMWPIYTAA